MRAEWIRTLFRPTALTTRSAPTISIAKLWRVGLSTALTVPRAKTRAKTIHGSTTPARRQRPQRQGGERHRAWVTMSRERFGKRSASSAAPGAEQEQRQELQRRGQPDRDAAPGQREDQPHLGDDLHPVAAQRDELAREVAAVVGDGQGGEGAAQRGAHRRSPSSSRSRISAARSSVATSSCVELAQAARQVGVLAGAQLAQQRPALGRRGDGERAPVGGSVARSTRRLVVEPGDDPSGGRPLDALELGQLAGGQGPVALDRRQRRGLAWG